MDEQETYYLIHDISSFESDSLEQLGTKSKFWYENQGEEFLFKSVQSNTGLRLGEDWAEKISCELAKLLGLPHAHYELAIHNDIRGVITKNFITKKFAMQRAEYLTTGNELLQSYINALDETNPNLQYVNHVHLVMTEKIIGKPISFGSFKNIKTASDFFVGYLMFDALVSNQDRHNENWGMIVTITGDNHLAPSYDHGASLARNESDTTRSIRLESNDKGQQIPTYAKKAKSQFQEPFTQKRLKLLEAFRLYGLMEKEAARAWLDKLALLDRNEVRVLIDKVPPQLMSEIAKDFTYQLIICNKTNLLDLYDEFL